MTQTSYGAWVPGIAVMITLTISWPNLIAEAWADTTNPNWPTAVLLSLDKVFMYQFTNVVKREADYTSSDHYFALHAEPGWGGAAGCAGGTGYEEVQFVTYNTVSTGCLEALGITYLAETGHVRYTIPITGAVRILDPMPFGYDFTPIDVKFVAPAVTMTVSYALVGGGSPTPPTFTYVLADVSTDYPLTTTPTGIQVPVGSSWSVWPNPLVGSTGSQRWYSTDTLSGTASSGTFVFTYRRQFYLTMQVNPSGGGSTNPTSGWQDSGSVTISATATCGYAFASWSGSGSSGKYTGTANPSSVTMNGAITETANFVTPIPGYGGCILAETAAPNPVGQGSKVTFTVTVHNIGTKNMPSSSTTVQVRIYGPSGLPTGGILVASPIDRFTPGAVMDVLVYYTLSTSAPLGGWAYDAYVYYGTTVLNQRTGGTFTVETPKITGKITSVTERTNPVARGGTAAFAVVVRNTGNTIWPSGRVVVKIYGPTGSLATTLTLTISDIAPGRQTFNSASLSWMVPSGAPTGTYSYEVRLYYAATQLDIKTGTMRVN